MEFDFDKDDEKMEAQLRQFRPQMPRPLPDRVLPIRNRRWPQLAMLGAVAAILLAVIFVVRPGKWKPEDTSAGRASGVNRTGHPWPVTPVDRRPGTTGLAARFSFARAAGCAPHRRCAQQAGAGKPLAR